MKDRRIILKKCPVCKDKYMNLKSLGYLYKTKEDVELWECSCCFKTYMFRKK